MNTILQKRIEEARKNHENSLSLPEWDRKEIHGIDFMKGATFALHNQWISVEEALPPRQKTTKGEDLEQSIPVFVRDNEGNYTSAWYSFYSKYWFMGYGEAFLKQSIYSKITHWMPIPSLKGGEE